MNVAQWVFDSPISSSHRGRVGEGRKCALVFPPGSGVTSSVPCGSVSHGPKAASQAVGWLSLPCWTPGSGHPPGVGSVPQPAGLRPLTALAQGFMGSRSSKEVLTWVSFSPELSSCLCPADSHCPYCVASTPWSTVSGEAGVIVPVSILPSESPQWEVSPLTRVTLLPSRYCGGSSWGRHTLSSEGRCLRIAL